ncbi:glycosyltransferase family 2 protein [Pseudonocardia sp. GCM10023141]|uniref:glycosyltransferase family 2 protein n=1 Tax=Pseudonocardia sp. GCM10023141 TaxID=3252653 RepID=UPI0036194C95
MNAWNSLPAPTWVGRVDRHDPVRAIAVDGRFGAARLLVTAGGIPIGTIELPLVGGRATANTVRTALDDALGTVASPAAPPVSASPLTVVVATRGRPDSVDRCVRALLAGDHPDVTVLVVDNDPVDDATAAVVRAIDDKRVRYVREPRRGASAGRNRGLLEADTAIVAFTDDDTEPDRSWASRITGAFDAEPELDCLSGPVLAARLGTPEELAADAALGWSKGYTPRRFALAAPPADSPIFPFSPGLFGIGANLAVRTDVARAAGGFDEALGPGSATFSGEDCEFLVRLVLAGNVLGYEPGIFVWHHHRVDAAALRKQVYGYAVGLGAFLTKIALDPRARRTAVRRIPAAVSALRRINTQGSATSATSTSGTAAPALPAGSSAARMRGLAAGPRAYLRSRRATRRSGGQVPALAADRPAPARARKAAPADALAA